MKKNVHLGCGKRKLEGYIHVDLADFPHIDYRHEINTLPMFEDESVDLIYACHCFEYFDRVEAVNVLGEWARVLKPGGVLRLAVPDYEGLAKVYTQHHDLDLIIGPMFGRWPIPGSDKVIYHKTIYDFSSLEAALETNGFQGVERWQPEDVFVGENSGFDDYSQAYVPHMDKNGVLISLNLEAKKV